MDDEFEGGKTETDDDSSDNLGDDPAHKAGSDVDIILELTNNASVCNKKSVSASCASGKTPNPQGDSSPDEDGDNNGESVS